MPALATDCWTALAKRWRKPAADCAQDAAQGWRRLAMDAGGEQLPGWIRKHKDQLQRVGWRIPSEAKFEGAHDAEPGGWRTLARAWG